MKSSETTSSLPAAAPIVEKSEPGGPSVLYDVDDFYKSAYEAGLARTGTPERGDKRRMRFYGLATALEATGHLEGRVAECGCWKGLSAFIICNYLRKNNPAWTGDEFSIVDSFEGLSPPSEKDVVESDLVVKGIARRGRPFKSAGAYAATLPEVRSVLADYPQVELLKGWIPSVLETLPSNRFYRFVHIDLDLYEPIIGALRYFYPRTVRGGLIVADDYGSLFFPGAKKALDEFSKHAGVGVIANATGQAILAKL